MIVLRRYLDWPGARWALGFVVTVYMIAKTRRPCLIYPRHGRWVHRYPRVSWSAPEPLALSPIDLERLTNELYLYEYAPKPGDLVIDIGAGFGSEVLTFSRLVGDTGKVIAVEAGPRTFACLQSTCRMNDLRNVDVVHVAISGGGGEVSITDNSDYLTNRISQTSASGARVPVLTLEELFLANPGARVAFLKMNIEGAELSALQGTGPHLAKIDHGAICCHDFRADLEGDEYFRTLAPVREILEASNFHVTRRTSPGRLGIRDTLYISTQSV
jgi:FkbM family methyltransferase